MKNSKTQTRKWNVRQHGRQPNQRLAPNLHSLQRVAHVPRVRRGPPRAVAVAGCVGDNGSGDAPDEQRCRAWGQREPEKQVDGDARARVNAPVAAAREDADDFREGPDGGHYRLLAPVSEVLLPSWKTPGEGGARRGGDGTCGVMTTSVAKPQNPVERREPTRPTLAMAMAN